MIQHSDVKRPVRRLAIDGEQVAVKQRSGIEPVTTRKMGTDFHVRKAAKKKRKQRSGDNENVVDFCKDDVPGGRKERRRRPKVRRLCRGACFQHPTITEEDAEWPEDEMVEGAGTKGVRRSDLKIIPLPDPMARPRKVVEEERTGKNKRKSDGGSYEMSTDVKLAAAPDKDKKKEKKKSGAPAGNLKPSEALQGFPEPIQRYMMHEGFAEATPVQEGCWPHCCDGKDVQGIAEPGSGKTLAFLLPAVVRMQHWGVLDSEDAEDDVTGQVLVMVPTRELAIQVFKVCSTFTRLFSTRSACLQGGGDKAKQIKALEKHPHIVVGTPGRVIELMEEGFLNTDNVKYVVLDEADKMLSSNMGLQLETIREKVLDPERDTPPQVMLFSATMPESVVGTADKWLTDPVKLQYSASAQSVSPTITQVVQVCADHKKPAKLTKHLQQINEKAEGQRNKPRVLVFANTVKVVRFLYNTLTEEGFKVVMLHGKRSQKEREEAMQHFRAGKVQIMVASDVAARGLHIRHLPYVVNYDFPSRLETYIHRVGRTGRLAAYGHAFSFFTRNLAKLAPDLLELLHFHNQAIDPNLMQLAEAFKTAEKFMNEMQETNQEGADADQMDEEDDPDKNGEETGNADKDDVTRDAGFMENLAGALVGAKGLKKAKKQKKGLLRK